ncbi:MAG: hypothetical protein Q4G10_04765 [Bacteroidia bacterium]|nr:hypothetical protein [Bacteroidia bacterium]
MKKILLSLIIALPLFGCANNNKVKSDVDSGTTTEEIVEESPADRMVGAFTEPREITPEELEMFKKATADYAELQLVPQNVATQVVAGINYKFFCDCKEGYNLSRCDVIIYKPLDGEPSVTKIQMK